jgi:hypothetical protein
MRDKITLNLTPEMLSALQKCYDACTARLGRPPENMAEMLDLYGALGTRHAGGHPRSSGHYPASAEVPKPLQNAASVRTASGRQSNSRLLMGSLDLSLMGRPRADTKRMNMGRRFSAAPVVASNTQSPWQACRTRRRSPPW